MKFLLYFQVFHYNGFDKKMVGDGNAIVTGSMMDLDTLRQNLLDGHNRERPANSLEANQLSILSCCRVD